MSRAVASVDEPPVAEVKSWVAGRAFPAELPLIDLSQAVPAYPPAPELRERLASLVRRDDMSAYAPALGLPTTRASVAEHFGIAADHVMITAGCNQAFCLAIGVLCEPGDNVILPVPYYFNHDMWLRANGVEARYEMADAPAVVDGRTRAIVLVTPNNPTGVIATSAEIAEQFDRARNHGIALILDETYKDFRPTADAAHDLFARDDWDATLIQLFSFSKVFSLAGYRAGSLAAHPDVIAQAAKLADCQTIGAPRLAQEAVAWALTNLAAWVDARRIEMNDKVNAFRHAITGSPYELQSYGAYFAYLRHPHDATARSVARRLADDQHLLCIPGECFGPGQRQHLRLAFGNATSDQMPEIARRLAASV